MENKGPDTNITWVVDGRELQGGRSHKGPRELWGGWQGDAGGGTNCRGSASHAGSLAELFQISRSDSGPLKQAVLQMGMIWDEPILAWLGLDRPESEPSRISLARPSLVGLRNFL